MENKHKHTAICSWHDLHWQLLTENIICPLGLLPFYCSDYSHIIELLQKEIRFSLGDRYAKMLAYFIDSICVHFVNRKLSGIFLHKMVLN